MQRIYQNIKECLKAIEINSKCFTDFTKQLTSAHLHCSREELNAVLEVKNMEYTDTLKRQDMTLKYNPTTAFFIPLLDCNKDDYLKEVIKEDYITTIKSFPNRLLITTNLTERSFSELPKLDDLKKKCTSPNIEITQMTANKFEILVKNSFIILLGFSNEYPSYYELTVYGLHDYTTHFNPVFRKENNLPSKFKRKMKEPNDKSNYKLFRKLAKFFDERFALQSARRSKVNPQLASIIFIVK
jgi:hypothetical protein